jgi:hypothetical protein
MTPLQYSFIALLYRHAVRMGIVGVINPASSNNFVGNHSHNLSARPIAGIVKGVLSAIFFYVRRSKICQEIAETRQNVIDLPISNASPRPLIRRAIVSSIYKLEIPVNERGLFR